MSQDILVRDRAAESLQQAIRRLSSPGKHRQFAMFELAVAIGNCTVLGIEDVASYPWENAVTSADVSAAVRELAERLRTGAAAALSLGKRWDAEADARAAAKLCDDLLTERAVAWAAMIGLESLVDAIDQGEGESGRALEEAAAQLPKLHEAFDRALEGEAELVASSANWRRYLDRCNDLAPPFGELRPWWLGDTLPQLAAEADQEVQACLRSELSWSRRRTANQGDIAVAPASGRRIPFLEQLERLSPNYAIAGDANTAAEYSSVLAVYRWRSPDGAFFAQLAIQAAADPKAGRLPLAIYTKDGDPTGGKFAGKVAELVGVRETLDAAGQARFSIAGLLAALSRIASGDASLSIAAEVWKFEAPGT